MTVLASGSVALKVPFNPVVVISELFGSSVMVASVLVTSKTGASFFPETLTAKSVVVDSVPSDATMRKKSMFVSFSLRASTAERSGV